MDDRWFRLGDHGRYPLENMNQAGFATRTEHLHDGTTVWSIEYDSQTISTALSFRDTVDRAEAILDCGLTLSNGIVMATSEVFLPTRPICFELAKKLVVARRFWLNENRENSKIEIDESACVEYEWGWVIGWKAALGYPKIRYRFPHLVDRVTANVAGSGGTKGLRYGITCLLKKRPPEFCGKYPAPPHPMKFDLVSAYRSAGAYTPINRG